MPPQEILPFTPADGVAKKRQTSRAIIQPWPPPAAASSDGALPMASMWKPRAPLRGRRHRRRPTPRGRVKPINTRPDERIHASALCHFPVAANGGISTECQLGKLTIDCRYNNLASTASTDGNRITSGFSDLLHDSPI